MELKEYEGMEEGLRLPGLVLLKNCGEYHDSVFSDIQSPNPGPLPFLGLMTTFAKSQPICKATPPAMQL